MPLTADRYLAGIYEIGTFAATSVTAGGATNQYNADNVYTLTPWATTEDTGAVIRPSMNRVKLRGGQSPATLDSMITEYDAVLETGFVSGTLDIIKKMWGLPDAAHTGDLSADPVTKEALVVRGQDLASAERQIYVKSKGAGDGPRLWLFPRCKATDLKEISISRTDWVKPGGAFDLFENLAGEVFFIEDLTA